MTPSTAAIATSVVAPEIAISHRTLRTKRAAAGSGACSSAVAGRCMVAMAGFLEKFIVHRDEAGTRLDRALATRLPEHSRSRHKALILEGHVAVNGATIRDPSERVNAGDAIAVAIPPAADSAIAAERMPLDIVYEDDAILVIDKPAGLVVHPAAGNWS